MIAYFEEQVARGADIPVVAVKRANSCKPQSSSSSTSSSSAANDVSKSRGLIHSARGVVVGKSGRGEGVGDGDGDEIADEIADVIDISVQ